MADWKIQLAASTQHGDKICCYPGKGKTQSTISTKLLSHHKVESSKVVDICIPLCLCAVYKNPFLC